MLENQMIGGEDVEIDVTDIGSLLYINFTMTFKGHFNKHSR